MKVISNRVGPGTGRHLTYSALMTGVFLMISLYHGTVLASEVKTGREIVTAVESRLWGSTASGKYEMTITTPYWKRTLKLNMWMRRPDKSFVRILSPAKEAGIGSLRIRSEMWNYLPKVERVIKIPPSMMLQPWMGSDFSNDDLVKESSMVNDYTHKVTGTENVNGTEVYRVVSTPKPEAAVIWGSIVYLVRKSDLMPVRQEYIDERGQIIKVLTFSDIRKFGDRELPSQWEMRPTRKPGNFTRIRVVDVVFNKPIKDSIFTLRNLRRWR
ncbi:MAG TPA: outer membrane lipoprotein-sorting protein [Gammaproteobacteria bacterium]|mgnify:CR=1 FL=1|nr:outer membrane lipoprotein-sorting protein [Gammaproteobacteria bacterium]